MELHTKSKRFNTADVLEVKEELADKEDLVEKQDVIDADNKLESDLVTDANQTNKFVTSQEKENWDAKLDEVKASDVDSENTTAGKVLTANGSGGASWETPSGGMTNPMNAQGDLIVGGNSGTPTRLGKGTAGQVLTMNSGATAPEWQTPSGSGGGTKLYEHAIDFHDDDDLSNTASIFVISTSSTPITSRTEFNNLIKNAISIKVYAVGATVYDVLALSTKDVDYGHVPYYYDGTNWRYLQLSPSSGLDDWNDTVTEL